MSLVLAFWVLGRGFGNGTPRFENQKGHQVEIVARFECFGAVRNKLLCSGYGIAVVVEQSTGVGLVSGREEMRNGRGSRDPRNGGACHGIPAVINPLIADFGDVSE